MTNLKLYGFLVSQPTRAVAWLLKIKAQPYELVLTHPPATVSSEFLKLNPNKLVPVLQEGDFSIFEGNAIMVFLAEKFGWTDLYPTDVYARAKVNQYLHWHHTNARQSTSRTLLPYVRQHLGDASVTDLEDIANRKAIIGLYVTLIEQFLVKDYVAESDHPTLADYACYCELDQLEIMQAFDFTPYPKVSAWLARMKQVPFHDEIRDVLNGFLADCDLKPVKN